MKPGAAIAWPGGAGISAVPNGRLDELGQGYQDRRDGENRRGIVVFG